MGLTSSLRMPSCTVITMASRRSISSFVLRAIPLAEFCKPHWHCQVMSASGKSTCQRPKFSCLFWTTASFRHPCNSDVRRVRAQGPSEEHSNTAALTVYLIRVDPCSITQDDRAVELFDSYFALQVAVLQWVSIYMHHGQLLQIGCLPRQSCNMSTAPYSLTHGSWIRPGLLVSIY